MIEARIRKTGVDVERWLAMAAKDYPEDISAGAIELAEMGEDAVRSAIRGAGLVGKGTLVKGVRMTPEAVESAVREEVFAQRESNDEGCR